MAQVVCSERMRAYFDSLVKEADRCYAVARRARARGMDPETFVEIPQAEDLASRVEKLLDSWNVEGVAARIRELSKDLNREEVSLVIAKEIATRPAKSKEEAIDRAVRVGLAVLTEGILVAPLEGIAGIRLGRNGDGTSYVSISFAGPIRSAGGTGQAMAVLIGDVVRRELGIGKYVPTHGEVERFKEEIPLYKVAQHLQFTPSNQEIELIVKNCPVCIDGEGTEDVEISGFRDLPRVETNKVRGGACLVIAEGMCQKAPKLEKHVKRLNMDGWQFISDYLAMKKKDASQEQAKVKPDPKYLKDAPKTFKSADAKGKEFAGMKFTVQVAPEDCTGCGACVQACPAQEKDENKKPTGRKAINMSPQEPLREAERENYEYFLSIPNTDPKLFKTATVKGSQLIEPLFEYSGACAGCGETPYVKLLTQLFGDRCFIGNATGCSSIYGGNLPTTPYTKRADGRGPTWSNSLFEDTAEFAMGMRLTVDKFKERALWLLDKVAEKGCVKKDLAEHIREATLANDPAQEAIEQQRAHVDELKKQCQKSECDECRNLFDIADYLVRKSVWGLGGDGWAYDIGYGGLDHVLASGVDVNLLVLDTEVYSNTGGQMSKSTPRAAVAKFAAAGKPSPKKDLGLLVMTYGSIYVAKVAMGANTQQTVRAFIEAEAYPGPSLIIAYSHCIAHGFNMTFGLQEQKKAVASGHWPLYRFDPRLKGQGKNPLQLDSKAPTLSFEEYAYGENRYRSLKQSKPEAAAELMALASKDAAERYALMEQLAKLPVGQERQESIEPALKPEKQTIGRVPAGKGSK